MRNTLSEFPVMLCCLWGGLIAGFAASVLRLPGRLYIRSLRGRREPFVKKLLFAALDAAACAAVGLIFCMTLIRANGGEPRAFAAAAFFCGVALPCAAVRKLI